MVRVVFIASILCACFRLNSVSFAQEHAEIPTDVLAEVGPKVITAKDLIERVELMPWPGKDRAGGRDSAMVKALQSLVAEQILAMEAVAHGLARDSIMRMRVKNLEGLIVRDELYRQEVRPKAKVSQREVREGLKRFAWQIKVLMIGARIRADARAISSALRFDGRVDSIITHPPGTSPITIDTVTVSFGLLERNQEDAVYGLTERVPASEPLAVPRLGWVVLYLLGKQTNPEYAKRSIPERTRAVTQKVRIRNELELANRYSANVLAPHRAQAKPATFDLFARTIYGILSTDSLAYRNEAGYRLDMVVDTAEARLEPHLNDVMVEMEGGGMSVADVLESYRSFDFLLPIVNKNDFRRRLNASVREVVARELMAREAYRRGLDQTEAVQHGVGTWSTYWLAQALMEKIVKDVTVSNEEVLNYLIGHADLIGRDYEVNVREVLSDSLKEALSLMEKIIAGGDMKDVARNFSKRKEWAVHNGESGFFVAADYPEIGFRALDSDTGKLIAPVKVPTGYSVFTVLGKKQAPGDSIMSYDSLKTLIHNDLRAEKVQQLLNTFLASAAKNHDVKLYYNRLKKVEIPPTNLVTRRFIGFGGSMIAVPALYPLWQWVRETKDVREIFP